MIGTPMLGMVYLEQNVAIRFHTIWICFVCRRRIIKIRIFGFKCFRIVE